MKFAGKRFFAILKLTRGLQVVFLSLAILFFLLALGDITGNGTITKIAGYEGIFTGASAIYVVLAEVITKYTTEKFYLSRSLKCFQPIIKVVNIF